MSDTSSMPQQHQQEMSISDAMPFLYQPELRLVFPVAGHQEVFHQEAGKEVKGQGERRIPLGSSST